MSSRYAITLFLALSLYYQPFTATLETRNILNSNIRNPKSEIEAL